MRRGRLLVSVLAAVVIAAGCSYTPTDLAPQIPPNARSSTIYAADGTPLLTLHGEENRIEVPLSRIPTIVRNAVIAIEDERYYLHNGVDVRAVLRALRANTTQGEVAEGASTITQQLVKNTLLNSGRTLDRKMQEVSLAWQLERHYSKDRILEIYLNTVYFGNGAYGVEAASQRYFGHPVDTASPAEAALLAALIQAPSTYDPLRNAEAALARRNTVLTKMLEQGYVTQGEHDAALVSPLGLVVPTADQRYPAAHFVDEVIKFIEDDPRFGATKEERTNLLFTGGLRIYTTVDLRLQAAAEEAVRSVLPDPSQPEAALVAVEPQTGYVRAMVGGRDYFGAAPTAKYNLAMGKGRGTGSAFKPYVLAAALNQGIPLSHVLPAPGCIDLAPPTGAWSPCNADPGENLPAGTNLVEGTVHSYNTLFAQLMLEVGPQRGVDMADRLGVEPPNGLEPLPSAVLGSNDVRVLDMAAGYASFANRGVRVPPTLVTKIATVDGTILYEAVHTQEKAITPVIADTVTSVLEQVILRGTGTAAKLDRPAAGKTGTGEDYKNAWFCGYTPELSTAVWVGFPGNEIEMRAPNTAITVYGGTWPARIWQAFMSAALAGAPVKAFHPAPIPTTTAPPPTTAPRSTTSTSAPAGSTSVPVVAGKPVPDVLGLRFDAAQSTLQAHGFGSTVVVANDPNDPGKAHWGRVWQQAPVGGATAAPGSVVTLWVNPG